MNLRSLALGGTFAALCGNAWGNGFAISGKSVSGLGNGLAGTTVTAEDASVVYSNPAAMRSLEGGRFSTLLHAIAADVHFDNGGSSTSGPDSEQIDEVHLVPGIYYTNSLNHAVSFGLGIYSPFGLGLDYDDDWVGRYHTTSSRLTTVNISPALAFSAGDRLAIGVGVDFQYADAELKKAVDFGTICYVYFDATSCAGMSLAPEQNDGSNTLSGSNWAIGYSLGLTYDLTETTRLGLSFHSATRHDVTGKSSFSGVPAIFASTFRDSDASMTMMLPESLNLGIRHTLTPRLELMADYGWMRWSRYNELVVKFTNGLTPVVEQNNWKDSDRYAIGMNYRWTNDWLVRAGLLYDQTPVPDAEHRSPRVPDSDKLSVALGGRLTVSDRLDLDVALLHTLPSTTEINNTDNLGHTLRGSYEYQSTYLSLQLNWKI